MTLDAREKARSRYHEIRKAAIKALGGRCKFCGFDDARALQFDHIEACGSARKGTMEICYDIVHGETGGRIQLLCANCNWIKRWEQAEVPLRGPVQRAPRVLKPRRAHQRPWLRLAGKGNA